MNKLPEYYVIIPAEIRYDKRLPIGARMIYGELTVLCAKEGYAWVSNRTLGEYYNVHKNSISRWISLLSKYDYISVELSGKDKDERIIKIKKELYVPTTKMLHPTTKLFIPHNKIVYTPTQNCYPSNIYSNRIDNNRIDMEGVANATPHGMGETTSPSERPAEGVDINSGSISISPPFVNNITSGENVLPLPAWWDEASKDAISKYLLTLCSEKEAIEMIANMLQYAAFYEVDSPEAVLREAFLSGIKDKLDNTLRIRGKYKALLKRAKSEKTKQTKQAKKTSQSTITTVTPRLGNHNPDKYGTFPDHPECEYDYLCECGEIIDRWTTNCPKCRAMIRWAS